MRAVIRTAVLAALVLRAVLPSPLRAATLEVPTAQFPTVQAALDAAADGDLVLVGPGTYLEALRLAGKTVTLASHFYATEDPSFIAQTVIDGGNGPFAISVAATVGPATTITGFTIRNADDGITAAGSFQLLDSRITATSDGIDYESGGGLVRNCVFDGNSDDGIDLDHDVAVVIEESEITSNNGDGIEIRLHPYGGAPLEVVIRNNWITDNASDGIQLIGYDEPTDRLFRIEGNLFVNNAQAAIGMMCCRNTSEDFQGASLPERVYITNNTFVGNDHGITGGDNDIVLNNLFVATTNLALKNVDGSSIAAYNGFWQNGTDWVQSNVDATTSVQQDPLLDANRELLPGSPAIDAGTAFFEHLGEVVLDLVAASYVGTAPDLGALEAGAGCSDGLDNDGDGLADFPDDPGCESAGDVSERTASLLCDDGLDNDGDGRIDFDPSTFAEPGDENTDPAGQGDPVCTSPSSAREYAQCQDGADNDGDGKMDYDGGRSIYGPTESEPDPQCLSRPWRNRESASRCGLGFELMLVLAPLTGRVSRKRSLLASGVLLRKTSGNGGRCSLPEDRSSSQLARFPAHGNEKGQ